MRRAHLICIGILLILIGCLSTMRAASKLKFGKVSHKELMMDCYEQDSTASAVYLIRNGNTRYIYKDGFKLITEYWVRVKVFTQEGVEYANVEVPYYAPDDKLKKQDEVTVVEGYSYNWNNGEIVKQSIDKQLISDERVTPYFRVIKFALPNVKSGTVFEYKYIVQSDYFYQIDNWQMQHEIPLVYSEYTVGIPDIFVFNIEFRGNSSIEVKQKKMVMEGVNSVAGSFVTGLSDVTISGQEYSFVSQNIPALHSDEPFCWCPEDHRIQVVFDLQGTNWPGQEYKSYSKTWKDVDAELIRSENEAFGKWLSIANPFLEETKRQGAGVEKFEDKVSLAFKLLKTQLTWNGNYRLTCENMDRVLEQKSGSNADLNFVLMSILRSLGIQAYPVVMSYRSAGVLPVHFPTLLRLNTFIIAVYHPIKEEYVYLDSSMHIPAINVLPDELCVQRARLLIEDLPEDKRWVDLSRLVVNRLTTQITAQIDSNSLSGRRTVYMFGKYAVDYLKKHPKIPSEITVQDGVALSHIQVNFEGHDFSTLQEQADFKQPLKKGGDRLYVNPMVFPLLETNPFKQMKRVLPVEFDYPYQIVHTCELKLPAYYDVEELPVPQRVKTEDGTLACSYWISYEKGTILLKYTFSVQTTVFPAESYKLLQQIWDRAVESNNSLVVLKRKDVL